VLPSRYNQPQNLKTMNRLFKVKNPHSIRIRQNPIGKFVAQTGQLITLDFNGMTVPFHEDRLEEVIDIEKVSWKLSLATILEHLQSPIKNRREWAIHCLNAMAEEADSVRETQDSTISSFGTLIKCIEDPQLAQKHKDKIAEVKNLVTQYIKEYGKIGD
jgi:hypothetical protein